MNPAPTKAEHEQWLLLNPLRGKWLIFKTLGDGEIVTITRKNDLSGYWVYFFTNDDGGYEDKMDAMEFLAEIEEVRETV